VRLVLHPVSSGAAAEAVKKGRGSPPSLPPKSDARALCVLLRPSPDTAALPLAPGFTGLTLTLTSTPDGLDVARIECAGEILSAVSRHGAEMKLAQLVLARVIHVRKRWRGL